MAKGNHLFPYRTQKLSPSARMVLGWRRPGRVRRCRIPRKRTVSEMSGSFFVLGVWGWGDGFTGMGYGLHRVGLRPNPKGPGGIAISPLRSLLFSHYPLKTLGLRFDRTRCTRSRLRSGGKRLRRARGYALTGKSPSHVAHVVEVTSSRGFDLAGNSICVL